MKSLFSKLMARFVRWFDPHLDRYRAPKKPKPPYTPKTTKEFIALLQRMPASLLSTVQRIAIASAMSYQDIPVSKIMISVNHVVALHEDDILGALTLDRLYQTGLNIFPVFDSAEQIVGLLRTENIDALEAVKTETKISDKMDTNVCYVRADYSLDMLLAAFLRTNNNFCVVINHHAEIVGYVTLDAFILKFFGEEIIDHFDQDINRQAVARRGQK